MEPKRIFIIEDEFLTVEMIQQILMARGYDVVGSADNGADALDQIERFRPDMILVDIKIKGDIDGVDLTRIINERYDVPVIYLTAFADGKTVSRAKNTETYGYIIKPFGDLDLLTAIEIGLHKFQIDRKLKESEKRYRTLFETMQDAMYIRTMEGKLIEYNPALLALFGYEKDELLNVNFSKLYVDPADRKRLQEEITSRGFVKDFETMFRRKNGTVINCLVSATIMTESDGKARLVRGMMQNITDRKRFENTLRVSESKFRSLFNSVTDPVMIHSPDIGFIEVNSAACELLGYTHDELIALEPASVQAPEDTQLLKEWIREIKERGAGLLESKLITRSGQLIPVDISARRIDYEGHPAVIYIARDVTERNRTLDQLKTAHQEISLILNSISSILIGVSIDDIITHWNRVAEETFGIAARDAIGTRITHFELNWQWEVIYEAIYFSLAEDRPVNLPDVQFSDIRGRSGYLGITINPIKSDKNELRGVLIYGKDITEKRMVEQQLLQSSKMATIGEIATGIAHELNQPLNIIKIASQFLLDGIRENYSTEEFITERVEKIVKQVDRAAHIITHLREFGRKSDFDFKPINPNLPIRVAFDLLEEQLRVNSISIDLQLNDSLPPINGDAPKLEQVFINLIVNSKDAFEEMKNSLQERNIIVKSFLMDDRKMICIEYRDTGPGIPANIVDRIFEPFFTTKEVGSGTGLGLSISYSIIKSHQGTIEVTTGAQGTTFTIRLPVSSGRADMAIEE
ncbi:MAG: hypothetical protein A2176_07660 [Spirochaetes bacterium RBG_13_51_14]|nr:MAG: hypothetical protein A2176_07660 [Spirochaetes bacterium RBG_13_51_14]